MQCPRCQGSGKCSECEGLGAIECPNCGGAGVKTTSRGATYDCKTCRAQGTIPCPKECSSCAGTGEITAKLQKETREKYQAKFANFSPSHTLTRVILGLNALVFLVLYQSDTLLPYFILADWPFHDGRWWTLLTPSFTHLSVFHLALNLYFLYLYGPVIEGLLGKTRYLLLYLFSSVTASVASLYGNVIIGNGHFAGIGASGPLFGLVGALLAIHLRWAMVPADSVKRLGMWALAFIVIGFLVPSGSILDRIDHWGHLGGFLGGFFCMYAMPRPSGR